MADLDKIGLSWMRKNFVSTVEITEEVANWKVGQRVKIVVKDLNTAVLSS